MNGDNNPTLPVWLLDVDGVISAQRPGWSAPPVTRYAYSNGHEHKLRWAPSLLAAIRELLRSDLVEIRWATSWVTDTPELERLFHLHLPCAFMVDHTAGRGTIDAAKLTAAQDVVTSGRRLLWTDDDAIPRFGPARDTLTSAGAFLLSPDGRRGLQRQDIDAIRAWLTPSEAPVPLP